MSKQIDLRSTSKATVRRAVSDFNDARDKSTLRFYTIESISEHRSYTPEGYLLCEGATLSRTGMMIYKGDEVPVTPGADGLVTVVRYEEDVFKSEAVASANGKSVCNNHPAEGQDITPENWRALEVGVILHPRRGTGEKHDCLVADLLIKDHEAIKLIESGKVQLSCGYDADYEELRPGYAKQYDIIINHVAIVENGRCGPRCAIMDEDTLRLNKISPSGNRDNGKFKMSRNLNTALSSLKDALNRTTISNRDTVAMPDDENETNELLELALEGLNNRLASIERRLGARDRRSEVYSRDDDDDDRRSRDRRDVRRRDDDDDRRSRDDDDDRRSRDRRDARRRDDDDDDRARDRRDARRRDDDDRSRDVRRRDDDDDRRSRDDDDDRRSRDRRDARRRDDDDDDRARDDDRRRDDAHFTDRRGYRAKDSASLEDSWKETISLAECLLPGVQAPKFVRDASAVSSLKTLCDFRKSVLSASFTRDGTRTLIMDMNGGMTPDFPAMSCEAAKTLFRDCAIVAKRLNNSTAKTSDAVSFGLVKINNPVIGDPSAFNEWATKHWATQYPESSATKAN